MGAVVFEQLPLKISAKWADGPMFGDRRGRRRTGARSYQPQACPLFIDRGDPRQSKTLRIRRRREDRGDPIDIGVKLGAMDVCARERGVRHRYVPPLIQRSGL
jgi:hypothetical protein